MKFHSDPKSNWTRKIFDEKILDGLSNRQRAEIETDRDLIKPIQQLLCDVQEETHNPNRTEIQNVASAQKRMVSLMARVAMTNDRLSKKIYWLTFLMTIMTLAICIMTYILVRK
ncbi:MAG: hypothetical protein ABI863_13045 [Ginsengibacter sp.]